MKPPSALVLAASFATAMIAGCAGVAAPTSSPTAPPAAASPSPTPSPTPGPTPIAYPGPSAPPGTLTLQLSALHVTFSTSELRAPADTPFVISFRNEEAVLADHNVAILLGSTLLFNPLPTVKAGQRADYFIPEGLTAGRYEFICILHQLKMHGILIIQ